MSGYREKVRWSKKQEDFLATNFEKYTDEQLSEILGRSLKSVRRKRQRMLIKKASGRSYCKKYVEPVKQTTEQPPSSDLILPQ